MVAKNSAKSTVVVVKTDWSEVTSWEAAAAAFQGDIQDATDVFGDGVKLVQKSQLVDREFMVLEMREVADKKTGALYWNVLGILRNGNKFCFNDGSTGVAKQCEEYIARTGRTGGVYCEKGLRVSQYQVEDPQRPGVMLDAETYYFA